MWFIQHFFCRQIIFGIKAILKIATVSLSPSFLVSTSFSVALHLRCLAWIKALANRSP